MRPVLFPLLLFACSSDPELGADAAPPADAHVGVVELGTGSVDFSPLADEQILDLVAGPQGGYHFIVHARLQDLAPGRPESPGSVENPTTTFQAFDAAGRQIDRDLPPYHLGYSAVGAWWELPSGRILQIENAEVPAIYGQRVRIRVGVVDSAGGVGEDERWIVAAEGPVAE